jgi:DNA-binding transcriptional regulator GbsR (MarR family)
MTDFRNRRRSSTGPFLNLFLEIKVYNGKTTMEKTMKKLSMIFAFTAFFIAGSAFAQEQVDKDVDKKAKDEKKLEMDQEQLNEDKAHQDESKEKRELARCKGRRQRVEE